MTGVALVLGVLIGLVIGALGGGGSVLTVPALVFGLGLSAQEATTGSLVIVGSTAAVAAVGHARSGHTRWTQGALLAAVGAPASLLGTRLNRDVAQDVLLLAFALLILVAAAGMLLRASSDAVPPPGALPPASSGGGARLSPPLVAAGLAIGFLTGFFGVGGGFVIVPVLLMTLRFPMAAAVGTSLLVIAVNCAVALVPRAGSGTVDWDVIAPFTGAAVLAALAGMRLASRMPAQQLTRAFGVLLLLVAGYVGAQAISGLA